MLVTHGFPNEVSALRVSISLPPLLRENVTVSSFKKMRKTIPLSLECCKMMIENTLLGLRKKKKSNTLPVSS